MGRLAKIVCVISIIMFAHTGVALALPTDWTIQADYQVTFYNHPDVDGNQSVGAYVRIDIVDDHTTMYQIKNEAFDPDNDGANHINRFRLPVGVPDPMFPDQSISINAGISNILVPGSAEMGMAEFLLNFGAGLVAGQFSDAITITHYGFELEESMSELHNSGEFIEELSENPIMTAMGGGGTGNGAPEPGTLLLVGSGLLGVGVLRRFRSKG